MNLYIYFFFSFYLQLFCLFFFFHWLWCCCSSSCSSSSIRPLMYTKTTPCLYTIPSCIFSPLINVDVLSKRRWGYFCFLFWWSLVDGFWDCMARVDATTRVPWCALSFLENGNNFIIAPRFFPSRLMVDGGERTSALFPSTLTNEN